ncbi:hypothetical protein CH333_03065 [candidate division WOR-3 bacterium JGI_Cruoil_03_44_89]|uniref:Uncharacterized protein n=1 Tax=candidate division WOR-3 bacterium JGI_Cruoil_03_44_89 TaxID=1973748 RepID=A0A235BWK7_UNCW3|nr:MAG: hypothetical protein CH333_03065 [candidate division WOR-3 bacterium JGI_Cruoil_03_44_89]
MGGNMNDLTEGAFSGISKNSNSNERINTPLGKLSENRLSDILAYVLDNDPIAMGEFVRLWLGERVPSSENLAGWKNYSIKREYCTDEGRYDLVFLRNSKRELVVEVKPPLKVPDKEGWERLEKYLDPGIPVALLCGKSEVPKEYNRIIQKENFVGIRTWIDVVRMLKSRLERELLPVPRVSMWCKEVITYVEGIMQNKIVSIQRPLGIRDLQVLGSPYFEAREVALNLLDTSVKPFIDRFEKIKMKPCNANLRKVYQEKLEWNRLGLLLRNSNRDDLSVFMGIGLPKSHFNPRSECKADDKPSKALSFLQK